MSFIPKSPHILAIALFLSWSADTLFYGRALGISVAIFSGLLGLALFVLARQEGVRNDRKIFWLVLPISFAAFMVIWRENPFLTLLNLGTIAFVFALGAGVFNGGRLFLNRLGSYLTLPLRTLCWILEYPMPVVREFVDWPLLRAIARTAAVPALRGVVLAMPVLLLFTTLLVSADLIFAEALANYLWLDIDWRLLIYPWRAILVVVLSWPLAGWLLIALRPAVPRLKSRAGQADVLPGLGSVEGLTVLLLVNLLFALFVMIQFAYLFGGLANIRLDGFTFADYARRGFFELLAVAILALALIQGLGRIVRPGHRFLPTAYRTLSSLMISLTLMMLISAFHRLTLYELAYGWTELRLYTHFAIIWLGILLIGFIGLLWVFPDGFGAWVLCVAFGFIVSLNLINPDAFIVRQNIARFQRTGNLDAAYLNELSADAVPALLAALPVLDNCPAPPSSKPVQSAPSGCAGTTAGEMVRSGLVETHLRLVRSPAYDGWPAWHASRWRAFRLLTSATHGP